MKTKTINLYEFYELSEQAKRTAIDQCRPEYDFWADENKDSLTKLLTLFSSKVDRYGNINSHLDDNILNLTGVRLATWIYNNFRNEIYKAKQYWICDGRPNCVGLNSKHRDSKVFVHNELGCNLTGFYMDNEILSPIFDFMRKPDNNSNIQDILSECVRAFEIAVEKDREFQNSDEQIIETIESNGYTFTEDGKLENE
jgi:hypothetical protein